MLPGIGVVGRDNVVTVNAFVLLLLTSNALFVTVAVSVWFLFGCKLPSLRFGFETTNVTSPSVRFSKCAAYKNRDTLKIAHTNTHNKTDYTEIIRINNRKTILGKHLYIQSTITSRKV